MKYGTTFSLESDIVGFMDEQQITYPFSVMAKNPKLFNGKTFDIIVENSKYSQHSVSANKTEPEELVLTDENAEKAFNILDKNGDGYLHKEEIVEVLTLAYKKFMEFSSRYFFAYSCLTAKDIAVATAQCILSSAQPTDGDYCLNFDDFCAWYLSIGTVDPLRDLMVMTIESISTTRSLFGDAQSPTGSRNSKARISHELEGVYDDQRVTEFAESCQTLLRLSSGSLSYLLDLIAVSAKGRSFITHDLYTKIFYVYLLQHNHQLSEADVEIVQILDTIFDLLSSDANDKIPLLELGSLLCTVNNGKYLQSLKTLFDMYPDSHTGYVSDSILINHLTQILRVVFYFNPTIPDVSGCFPEDLGCALATKVLLLIDSKRKMHNKLSFDEFAEAFLHGLMIGLNMLHIRRGYFHDYLLRLMTYIGDAGKTALSGEGDSMEGKLMRGGSGEDEEGEDVESYGDEEEAGDGESSTENDPMGGECSWDNTEAAVGKLASMTEEDTLDDESSGSCSSSSVQLEDSQVSASEVGYEGLAITVLEARLILGLTEYSSKVLCNFILQELADARGDIDQEIFFRGLSRLIGDQYNSAPVLTRSKIDFILSRLFSVFDPEDTGMCSAVELGCGLLLFCGDDAIVRARVAWELLESDVAHGNALNYDAIVRAISALIKAQVCLDPSLEIDMFLSAVEVRGNLEVLAFFPERSLDRVVSNSAPNFLELFSCTLFMCQSEAMDLELDQYRTPAANGHSSSKHEQGSSSRAEHNREYGEDGEVASDPEVDNSTDVEEQHRNSPGKKGSCNNLTQQSFSHDMDEDGEEENIYASDKHFPPSAVVLELRAARAILGLETYAADDMMASLAENSPGGELSVSGWQKWFFHLIHQAGTPEQDLSIAISLGNRLFDAFVNNPAEGSPMKGGPVETRVKYERVAAGLAFLCGGSPLEERLMVAFTVMDADSDGCITPVELLELINSALIVISVCSRMVADKVLLLGAPLTELAEAAAIEAISALNVDDTAAYITLEMLCEMSDDFLKLTALF